MRFLSANFMAEPFVERIHRVLNGASTVDCSLCYEPTSFVGLGKCGHAEVCWLCVVRLRWICKDEACAICKHPLDTVEIVSVDGNSPADGLTTLLDGVRVPNASLLPEAVRLRSYICPFPCGDASTTFHFKSLRDLQTHLKRDHDGLVFCAICLDNRQCFLPEQTLYSPGALTNHLKADHAGCDFCRGEKFYSTDELLAHMQMEHFKCVVCERLDYRNEYYANFETLNTHSTESHFPCDYPECREQRFVVFMDEDELRLHGTEKHGRPLAMGSNSIALASRKRMQNKIPQINSQVHFRGAKGNHAFRPPVLPDRYLDLPNGRVYDKRVHADIVRREDANVFARRTFVCLEKISNLNSSEYVKANNAFLLKLQSQLALGEVDDLKTNAKNFRLGQLTPSAFIGKCQRTLGRVEDGTQLLAELISLMPDLEKKKSLMEFLNSKKETKQAATIPRIPAALPNTPMPTNLFETPNKPSLVHALSALVEDKANLAQVTLNAMECKINGLDRIQLATLSEMRNHLLTLGEHSWTHTDEILSLRPLLYRLLRIPDTHKYRERELVRIGWAQFVNSAKTVLGKFSSDERGWIKAYISLCELRLGTIGPLASRRSDFPPMIVNPAPRPAAPTKTDFPNMLPRQSVPVTLGVRGWQNAPLRDEAFPNLPVAIPAIRDPTWACPRCTFLNTRGTSCEICGKERPEQPVSSIPPSLRPKKNKHKLILSSSSHRDYNR